MLSGVKSLILYQGCDAALIERVIFAKNLVPTKANE